jgi:hypothetical protein
MGSDSMATLALNKREKIPQKNKKIKTLAAAKT